MKKQAVLAVCLGLTVAALTGCGAKKMPTAQELIDGMNAYEMDSYTVDGYFNLELDASSDDEEHSLSANVDFKAEVEGTDDCTAYVTFGCDVDVDGDDESIDAEAYVATEGKGFEAYVGVDGEWISLALSEDELNELAEDAGVDMDFDLDQYTELSDKITNSMKDFMYTAEVGKEIQALEDGTECYVMTLSGTGSDLTPVYDIIFKEVDGYEDLLEEAGIDKDDFYAALEYIPFTATYYVSVADGYLVAADFDFSGIDMEGMMESYGYDFDDLGIESFDFTTLEYGFTFTKVDDTKVDIPSDVKDEAIDLMDMIGMYMGGYDYEIDDFDIDDYDFDDDDFDDDDDDDTVSSDLDSLGDVIDVCDYYGESTFTCTPGNAGFVWTDTAEDSDGTVHYYTIEDDDDTTIYLNTWAGEVETPLNDALHGDDVTDSEFVDYEIDQVKMDAKIDGRTCYFVTETYTNSGKEFLWYYIICEYEDSNGAKEYFTVEIADDYYWDIEDAEALISLMFE